jgi:hypothetical protein
MAMPKTPHPQDTFQASIRLPTSLAPWVQSEVKQVGNFNQLIRDLVEDGMTLYGLPQNQVDRLRAEAKARGLNRREYVRYVLSLHAEQLVMSEQKSSKR